jgi:predicted CXXCH cytochrome family protein
MRKTLTVSLVMALGLVLASAAFAYTGTYTAGAGITGTPHDLSRPVNGMDAFNASPADSKTRVCIFCHAPHNAYKLSQANGGPAAGVGAGPTAPDAFDYLPLWNHTLPVAASYSMYYAGPGAPLTGPKAQQSLGAVPGSTSLLCLSCHDGSVAVNSYGNGAQPASAQSTGSTKIGSGYVIGQDGVLQNHHPIGFSYGAVAAVDTEIRVATTPLGSAGTIANHLYASAAAGAVDTMECGTCHSVHNTGNTGESLLWRSDANSALCLTCHAKGTAP